MMLAGGAVLSAGSAALAYTRWNRGEDDEQEPVLVERDDGAEETEESKVINQSWKESAGRDDGRDGYVFGDVTRGVIMKMFGKKTAAEEREEARIEAAADEQYTHVQRLIKEAIGVYRARGYQGTISVSQSVAYFSESASISVTGPKESELPWDKADTGKRSSDEALTAMAAESSRAGRVFSTLLARLERRAASWQAMSGTESLDPSLTSSAQIGAHRPLAPSPPLVIPHCGVGRGCLAGADTSAEPVVSGDATGFRVPVLAVGWGVSISLTVTTSSLLRWSAREKAMLATGN